MEENLKKELEGWIFLANFVKEHKAGGKMTKETADQIEALWNKYKLPTVDGTCAIITADFGNLGSIVIREVKSVERPIEQLEYKSGNYDYISIVADKTARILWTDYKNIEPYNRQSGLYCDGASFGSLGSPVVEKEEYREFHAIDQYDSNICFAVWGYRFNDFYGSVTFGMSIKKDLVDEFIVELRKIINK